MNVYISDRIVERINIPANYVNKNLDIRILDFVKNKIGDKCVESGYINSKDIEIIGRTNGLLDVSHFTGNIVFDVECKVVIFNPPDGAILYCIVVNKNKMGLVVETAQIKPSPIRILLAREHHQDNDLFNDSVINDRVYVEIIAKRYEYNDIQIQAIGSLSTKDELLKQNPSFVAKKTVKDIVLQDKPIDICDAPISPPGASYISPGLSYDPKTPLGDEDTSPGDTYISPGLPYDPKTPLGDEDTSPDYIPKSQLDTSPTYIPTDPTSPGYNPLGDTDQLGFKPPTPPTPPYTAISPSFELHSSDIVSPTLLPPSSLKTGDEVIEKTSPSGRKIKYTVTHGDEGPKMTWKPGQGPSPDFVPTIFEPLTPAVAPAVAPAAVAPAVAAPDKSAKKKKKKKRRIKLVLVKKKKDK
jgi:DNA-directed RNA polymerase subunit E'/Rpb7